MTPREAKIPAEAIPLKSHSSGDSAGSRYGSLDALRGAAAVIVVFGHCLMTFPLWEGLTSRGPSSTFTAIMALPPLALFWAGRASVIVFFALSGFVLTLMLERKPAIGYRAYVAKRVCRLYVPYITGVILAMVLMQATSPHGLLSLSPWFNASWSAGISAPLLVDHALMLGSPNLNYVDNPIWSLVHEMRFSLIFPLIVSVAKRWPPKVILCSALLLSLCARALLIRTNLNTLVDSLQYVFVFVGGAVVALKRDEVRDWYRRLRPWIRISLAALSLCLLCAGSYDWIPNRPLRILIMLAMHTGSVLLILCIVGAQKGKAILETAPLAWLGKISYSLYLIHVVVLLTLVYLLRNVVSPYLVVPLAPVFALLFAAVFNRLVEQPAIKWGRNLARRIDAKQIAEAVR